MSLSQNDSGRALEYGIAMSFSNRLPADVIDNSQKRKAKKCFEKANESEKESILNASEEIVTFLIAHDDRLSDTNCIVEIQSDKQGQLGDVRDIIIKNNLLDKEIGLSVKNRHFAVKHSRLSDLIDFGADWMNIQCSEKYFATVKPIFKDLRTRKSFGEKWRDIPDKRERYYIPILHAFKEEIENLFQTNSPQTAKTLINYLLGRHDFYKVIKQTGTVSAMSFNVNGTLKWGKRLPMPTKIQLVEMKPDSDTTLNMIFDKGWQLSFRIHNASSKVEPSLKFDINLVGVPSALSKQDINYRHK